MIDIMEKDDRVEAVELLTSLKDALPVLEDILANAGYYDYEDGIYRFYHQSFKVYALQDITLEIVKRLQALAPGRPLNDWFMRIVRDGTGRASLT